MSTSIITVNNKNFELACSQESKEHLSRLVDNLNKQIIEIKKKNPFASYELLLVMAAISLQDQVESANHQSPSPSGSQHTADSELTDAINFIANKLDNITNKIISEDDFT